MSVAAATSRLRPPPRVLNAEGRPRRFGIELEMNGLPLDALTEVVAGEFGLEVDRVGRYERRLIGDPAGDWGVEIDSSILKRMGREVRDPGSLAGGLGRSAEDAMALVAATWIPVEVVSPPLPFDRLGEVEALIARLRGAGARGTSDALVNAFGTQINPEAPDLGAEGLTAVIRAFACLYEWLRRRADVNISRRITSFVDPYPTGYVRHVTAPDYAPDRDALVADYLRWNPTRNRALDLLPLFAEIAPTAVARAVDDDRIKPRPAFHYRLPDCEIHHAGWGLHSAWNDWIEVEALADDADRLAACAATYHRFLARPVDRWLGDWASEVERTWLAR